LHDIINQFQTGFRKQHSTIDNILFICIIDIWARLCKNRA